MFSRYLPIAVVFSALISGVASWAVSKPIDEKTAWRILRVAVSKSGRWIAVGSASGWIGIIDQNQPDTPQRFRGGEGELRDLRFTRDERWLIVTNAVSAKLPVETLGSLEPLMPGEDPGEPQTAFSKPFLGQATSNVVAGPNIFVFGNAGGSIEVRDQHRGTLVRRFTFR